MSEPSATDLQILLQEREPPCISLYLPTHRNFPGSEQDPVHFANLLRQTQSSLERQYPKRDFEPLLARFRRYVDDADFWKHGADGLAMFGSDDHFAVFKLQRPVPQLLVVAESFHTKPLVRILQSAERYQILAVSRSEARLYEGTRDTLERIAMQGVPATVEEALGEQLTEPYLKVSSYNTGAQGPAGAYHGHGSKKDEVDLDRDRFFRAVDRAVLERYSRPSGLPLVLAALPEHQSHFRRISHNPLLIEPAITTNPHAMSLEQLRAAAWERIEPLYLERLARLKEDYGSARAHGRGSDDPAEIAAAAEQGRVGRLLVEAERRLPGRIEPGGRIVPGDLDDPDTDDVLDDLAEKVLRTKGEVVIVPASRMPAGTGVAATYRY